MDDVWVIVPTYNEEPVLARTIVDLQQSFTHIVCVDDGSTDGSGDVALAAGATVLRHVVNLGQGAALQTGFDYVLRRTSAAYVVTFDADGQHEVADAVRMVECARSSACDVVLASRFTGHTHDIPWARARILHAGVWFTRRTTQLDVTDTHNGLRVLSRTALSRIRLGLPRMAYASELLGAIVPSGLSYCEVPVTVNYTTYSRAKGQRNSNSLNILFDLAVRKLRAGR